MPEYSSHPLEGACLWCQFTVMQHSPKSPFSLLIWLNSAFTCHQSFYLGLFCFTVILVNTTLSVAVGLHHSPYSWCCVAFHTMPTASNEAELAFPKGGFMVARHCLSETNWPGWGLFIWGIITQATWTHTHKHLAERLNTLAQSYSLPHLT